MNYKPLCQQLIHPGTKFGKNVRMGFGVVIEEGCEIGDNTLIGHYVILRPKTRIGKNCKLCHYVLCEGDVYIGDNVRIGQYSLLTRYTTYEDNVWIGAQFCSTNDRKIGLAKPEELIGPTVKKNARIAVGVTLNPGITIGEGAVIWAKSMVTRDVPPGAVMAGIPAKARNA